MNLFIKVSHQWKISFYITIAFIILSSPFVYRLKNNVFKRICSLSNKDGSPTLCGILIHSFIFMIIVKNILDMENIYEGVGGRPCSDIKKIMKNLSKEIKNMGCTDI